MKAMGRRVRITPRLPVAEGINAARTLFNRCWRPGEVRDGLSALRRYRYLAVALQPKAERKPKRPARPSSWMG